MGLKSLFFNIERVFDTTGFNFLDNIGHGFKIYSKKITFYPGFYPEILDISEMFVLLENLLENIANRVLIEFKATDIESSDAHLPV